MSLCYSKKELKSDRNFENVQGAREFKCRKIKITVNKRQDENKSLTRKNMNPIIWINNFNQTKLTN